MTAQKRDEAFASYKALQAQSQKIDAEIDVRRSQVDLQKSLGILE
jgi:hypothetical protein